MPKKNAGRPTTFIESPIEAHPGTIEIPVALTAVEVRKLRSAIAEQPRQEDEDGVEYSWRIRKHLILGWNIEGVDLDGDYMPYGLQLAFANDTNQLLQEATGIKNLPAPSSET